MICYLLRLMTSSEANSDLSIHLRDKAWPLWLLKISILPIIKAIILEMPLILNGLHDAQ